MNIRSIRMFIFALIIAPLSIQAMQERSSNTFLPKKASPTRSPFSMKNIERDQMTQFNHEMLNLVAAYDKARRSGSIASEKENLQEYANLIAEYAKSCEDEFARKHAAQLIKQIKSIFNSEMEIEQPRHCVRAKRNLAHRAQAMNEIFEKEEYTAREIQIPVAQLTPVILTTFLELAPESE